MNKECKVVVILALILGGTILLAAAWNTITPSDTEEYNAPPTVIINGVSEEQYKDLENKNQALLSTIQELNKQLEASNLQLTGVLSDVVGLKDELTKSISLIESQKQMISHLNELLDKAGSHDTSPDISPTDPVPTPQPEVPKEYTIQDVLDAWDYMQNKEVSEYYIELQDSPEYTLVSCTNVYHPEIPWPDFGTHTKLYYKVTKDIGYHEPRLILVRICHTDPTLLSISFRCDYDRDGFIDIVDINIDPSQIKTIYIGDQTEAIW